MSPKTTLAPSSTSARTSEAPMPRAPPLTTATLPANRPAIEIPPAGTRRRECHPARQPSGRVGLSCGYLEKHAVRNLELCPQRFQAIDHRILDSDVLGHSVCYRRTADAISCDVKPRYSRWSEYIPRSLAPLS